MTPIQDKLSSNESVIDDNEEAEAIVGLKRGRKVTNPNKYCFESQKKIDDLQAKLDHDKTLT